MPFQVCLDDFCITESNGPENEPEYVTLPISDISEQPNHTSQPQEEDRISDTSQPPNQEDEDGWLISILLIAVAAVIGIVRRKRLLNVVDGDHKNGKRYDNSESNCQALSLSKLSCHKIA